MQNKIGVGIIGCGNISDIYLKNLELLSPRLQVVACAARTAAHAEETAAKYGLRAETVEQLLQDSEIALVVNLTTPDAHYEITKRALLAGKHVYSEKPIALEVEQAKELQLVAEQQGVRLGCSPDTVLGAAVQTCRQILDSGALGEPLSASIFFGWHGPECEHPNPAFLYRYGAGPMFDYGPYYLSTLVTLLGPIKAVMAMARTGFAERTCTCSGPHCGEIFPVETPTHITGTMELVSGAIVSLTTSFDIQAHGHPFIEVYCTEGTLRAPDPDCFSGEILITRAGRSEFEKVHTEAPYAANSRGLGLADLVRCMDQNTPHRADAQIATHVLEVMHAFLDSAAQKRMIFITSTCEQPAVMELIPKE